MKDLSFHEHRVLVAAAWELDVPDSHCAIRYFCEDPTCDWCITEHTGGSCKDLANFRDGDLTSADFQYKVRRDTDGGSSQGESVGPSLQTSLFEGKA